MVASPKGKAAFAYLMTFMKDHPKAVYADAAAAAKKAGHAVYPIMWGRAQGLLGRVKMRPRGEGKAARAANAGRPPRVSKTGKRLGRPPGSKNKPKTGMASTAGTTRSYTRRAASSGTASLTVDSSNLANAQALVDALNNGGRAALRYDDGAWTITAAG